MNLYIKTPLLEMLDSGMPGKSVEFKMEIFQPSGSFKIRGMENLCRQAMQQGAKRLISSSGGNAGLSAAYVGRKLGLNVTVVLPESTPQYIIDHLKLEDAETIVHGVDWNEANTLALSLITDETSAYIPPFDHPALWEGHSTMIDELEEQPDLIILSVGGGGLMCGVVEGLIKRGWYDTTVLAVETKGADSFHQSVVTGEWVTLDSIDSIATSLGARRVAKKAIEYANIHPIISQVVTDEMAMKACARFAEEQHVLVEPACGASLSVVYEQLPVLDDFKKIVVIVCGGTKVHLDEIIAWREL